MAHHLNSRSLMTGRLRKAIAALVCALTLAGSGFASDIYLAPNGNDSKDGASVVRAVRTLQRAVELAAEPPGSDTASRILVQRGTYSGQSVVIDGNTLPRKLTVIGQAKDPADFPVFVGDSTPQTWLTLRASNGRSTGLTIQALQIRDYFTAISLEGNRDDLKAYNSGTTIRRNVFRNIGSIATKADNAGSTAAVRFVNSRDNLVELNYFRSIRNKKGCGALHALYLAHFSSGNRIVNNTFDDACGSVIKLRDRSNDNVIENNRFKHIQKAPAVEEWFCDMDARKDCTKKRGECPSTGNIQRKNTLTQSEQSEMLAVIGNQSPRTWCAPEDFSRERILTK